jgi:hypothetical protein
MDSGAQVVFHSPFRESDPSHADETGAVVVGQYLAEMGIDLQTSIRITGRGPNDYFFLSADTVNPIIPFTVNK